MYPVGGLFCLTFKVIFSSSPGQERKDPAAVFHFSPFLCAENKATGDVCERGLTEKEI